MLDMAPHAQQVLNKCLSNDKLIQTGSLFGGNYFCFKKHLTPCILVICCKYFQTTVVAMGLELRRWGTAICLEQWETYRMGFLSACFIFLFFLYNQIHYENECSLQARLETAISSGPWKSPQGARQTKSGCSVVYLALCDALDERKLNWVI